jgi:hypothetical protein
MNKNPPLNLQENRDIWQVLNATFTFLGVTFKSLYIDIILISGPFYILAGIFSSLSTYNTIFRAFDSLGTNSVLSTYRFFTPAYWVYLVCLLIGWSLSTCIIANHVLQYKLHGPGYNKQAARDAIKKDLFRVIMGNFLNILVVIAASILFIIPGIYLAVANSLLTVVIILDKKMDMVDAFAESRRLIKDNWWKAVMLGIVATMITYVIEMIFTLPSSILSGVILFHSVQGNSMESYSTLFIVLNAIASLGLTLVAPFSIVCSCIYYYSLKEQKDHISLMESIDNIGVQTAKTETETKDDEGDF